MEWHNLSESALDLGLNEYGLVSRAYIRPIWEGVPKQNLNWPILSEDMIRSALDVFGRLAIKT